VELEVAFQAQAAMDSQDQEDAERTGTPYYRFLSEEDLGGLKQWSTKPYSVSLGALPASANLPGGPKINRLEGESYEYLAKRKTNSRHAVAAMFDRLQSTMKKEREQQERLRSGVWYEGFLWKDSGMTRWRKYYVILTMTELQWYNQKPTPQNKDKVPKLNYVDLKNIFGKVAPINNKKRNPCFLIKLPNDKEKTFHCDAGQEIFQEWIDSINKAVFACRSQGPQADKDEDNGGPYGPRAIYIQQGPGQPSVLSTAITTALVFRGLDRALPV